MKIALINVSGRLSAEGSRLISALLKRAGHSVRCTFLARAFPVEYEERELDLLHEILKDTDLAMLAVYSHYSFRAVQITEFIRKKYPGMKVIWGGPHCVSAPELSLRHADGVCFSEGDECVVDFVSKLEAGEDYFDTPSMAFNVNGSHVQNDPLPPFMDLDSLPFSDFSLDGNFVLDGTLMPLTKETLKGYFSTYPFDHPTFWILTSRGCPHRCSYCNNCRYIAMFGRNSIRTQSVGRLMDELEHCLEELDFFDYVAFGDDDFFVRPTRQIEEFAQRYKKNVDLPYTLNVSAKTYRKHKLEILLDTGIKIAQFGVQSGSERVLSEVFDRKISLTKIKEIAHDLVPYHETHGLRSILDFIVDNPYETRDDIAETYRYLIKMPPLSRIHIYTLAFFPGTPIYDRALADGFIRPFAEKEIRSYGGRITYQVNYETFLVFFFILIHRRRLRRIFPNFFMRLLGVRPLRAVMSVFPKKFYHYLITLTRMVTPDTLKA